MLSTVINTNQKNMLSRAFILKSFGISMIEKNDLNFDRVEMFKIEPVHYGDIQVFTNIVYNCAVRDGFKAKIHFVRQDVGRQIMSIFDYGDYIEPVKNVGDLKYDFRFGRMLNLGRLGTAFWCALNFGHASCRPDPLENFKLPKIRIPIREKRGFKCFQLNGHSPRYDKPKLTIQEMDRAIKKFKDGNTYVIGGLGSNNFFPDMPTNYTNLYEQAKFLLACKSFFGIDSGMSHLSGTLGVDGDIIIQANTSHFSDSVEVAYNFMYPTFRMHKRGIVAEIPTRPIKLL